MSTERETTRVVRSWLEEGVTRLPDRVLDLVLDEVPATPQRRSRWPARRSNFMSSYAKLAAAAAAVLVVAVVAYQFLPGNGPNTGGRQTPAPSPTAAPTEVPPPPSAGPIEAGTYRLDAGPPIVVTVPAGWARHGLGLRKHNDEPNEVALDLWSASVKVFDDACQSKGTREAIGPTAADLLTALRAQDNSEISDPVDIMIDGLPGKRFEISAPSGLDTTTCSIGSLQIWVVEPEDYLAGMVAGGPPVTIYVADSPGGRLLFSPHHEPAATAPDLAELDSIVASIRFAE